MENSLEHSVYNLHNAFNFSTSFIIPEGYFDQQTIDKPYTIYNVQSR